MNLDSLICQHESNFVDNRTTTASGTLLKLVEQASAFAINYEYDRAIDLLKEVKTLATRSKDVQTTLQAYRMLSDCYLDKGDYQGSLSYLMDLAVRAADYGDKHAYIDALVGIGNLCCVFGEHDLALRYYRRISRIEAVIDAAELKFKYRLYKLNSALECGDTVLASQLLFECEELISQFEITGSQGQLMQQQVYVYRAKFFRMQGNIHRAFNMLASARHIGKRFHTAWLRAAILYESCCCLNQLGKVELSVYLLARARRNLFQRVPPYVKTRLLTVESQALEGVGDFARALACEKEAHELISIIIDHSPITDLVNNCMPRLSKLELKFRLSVTEKQNIELKAAHADQQDTVAKLEENASRDLLTGLFNRRGLEQHLQRVTHIEGMSVLMMDIDHFKAVNDDLTHIVGDKVLERLGQFIEDYFSEMDCFACRFGGEEFVLLFPHCTADLALQQADGFRKSVYEYDWSHLLPDRKLSVSIGVSECVNADQHFEDALYRADKALYMAKAMGRNCSHLVRDYSDDIEIAQNLAISS
ncbi:hypothetical protein VST7929_01563 [Vibrio stylophorae]|uniref:diguanylate cyclase n=1 Tax=Vibrio stylophorae TaxID=659351 RepID=A0ABN8DSB0_9VIBR|nr:tetratricopeptide repeat-containing diguanylate cyclase [Vibrio stylophorae]CAH0533690.1 hypothetical protein VST7929_01563 [Vibrio stylophorae]